ncbi:hypothetical protein [Shewanella sp. WXL01]|uniref:hypothetical protein n=1 Tax=Shewanella sp. WXL01 TaxID=2709721 RepID=UPI001FDA45B1|nr:hypothetical protein [Shewanella sp. WXL01]
MQIDWLLMALVWVASGLLIGNSAFYQGLAVKRWACAGFILGPAAYPLFNAHKRIAQGKLDTSQAGVSKF